MRCDGCIHLSNRLSCQSDATFLHLVGQLEQAAAAFPEGTFLFLHVDVAYTGCDLRC